MTEHPSMVTPGSLIRAAREARQMTLAELSERTKIPPPVIDAIERDEYHKVSGALYIKSFLRTCSVELGLETEEVLELYGSFSGERRSTPGSPDTVWEENKVEISHIGLPWRNIGLAGVGLVVIGLAVLLVTRGCDGDSGVEEEPGGSLPTAAVESVSDPADSSETPAHETLLSKPAVKRDADADSLASAWTNSAAPNTAVVETPDVGSRTEAVAAREELDDDQEVAEEKPVAVKPAPTPVVANRSALPLPLVGGPRLVFAGGERMELVLRIIADRPVGIQVKQDALQAFQTAKWPAEGTSAPPLPPTGIEAGRVYGVRRGLVVYWGADDHFSLRLDRTDGVEASLNGKLLDVRNLRPGGEMLLDNHGD